MSVYRDTTTSHVITTDAGFRAWAQMVHDGLAAVGMVQTADTGQINLATVTTPAVNGTFAGYEIWRFNDSDQSNNPIYFKIEYGRGGASDRPSWRWNVGTGSDGAGNLTNAAGTIATNVANSPSGTPEFHCCHVDGCLVLAQVDIPASGFNICVYAQIERLRDENGNVITTGGNRGFVYMVGGGSTINQRKGTTNSTGLQGNPVGAPSSALPDGRKRSALMALGDNNPQIGFAFFKASEVANGDSGTLQVYGTNRTYRVTTAASTSLSLSAPPYTASSPTCFIAILNE